MKDIHNKSGKARRISTWRVRHVDGVCIEIQGRIIVVARNDEHVSTYSVSFFPLSCLKVCVVLLYLYFADPCALDSVRAGSTVP
jgi:hypothetical protein